MSELRRYDRFGWDYDAWNPPDAKAEAWYLGHLAQASGPVLELACGAGKLLATIARAGHEVVGLDLSDAMLALARQRIDDLPTGAAARVSLVQADMGTFDLGRRFAAVVLADNSFRELPDLAGLRACLACIQRHLEPDGQLLLTERRFDPARFAVGAGAWSKPLTDPRTGARVRRKVEARVLESPRRIEGVMHYEITAMDGTCSIVDCPYGGPVLLVDEYRTLFEAAAFDAQLFVDFEERPDDGVAPMLCFVLSPA